MLIKPNRNNVEIQTEKFVQSDSTNQYILTPKFFKFMKIWITKFTAIHVTIAIATKSPKFRYAYRQRQ